MDDSLKRHGAAPPEARLFRDIFELSITPWAVFNEQGACLLANRAFLTQLGYAPQDLPWETVGFKDLFEEAPVAAGLLARIKAGQVIRGVETTLVGRAGRRLAVLISGGSLSLGSQPGFEISFTDISQQKSLQQAMRHEHARLSSLIDNQAAGLFLVNQEGLITEFNQTLANLIHKGREKLLEQPYQQFFAWLSDSAVEPEVAQRWLNRAVLEVARRPSVEVTLTDPEGALRHLEVNLFPVRGDDGLPLGWGGLVQDITELREQTAWKLELLSILSHDLRSPLATLKGHATALLANYQRWGTDMVIDFLDSINRSVDSLTRQVDRNLALTRVESGRLGLRPEAVEPVTLIQRSIERAGGLLGDRALERHLPAGLPAVRADPARVEEVIINLLENAARYSPPSQPIRVSAQAEPDWLAITVADAGPGVPAEKQEQIFEKFARAGPQGSGTGLGLYISRKIVEAHGGRIWVESPPPGAGQGAAFTFTLPLMPAIPQSTPRAGRELPPLVDPQGSQDCRILVVEDEPDFQALIRTILTDAGYEVELATDGAAALDILQTAPPDLVLLDLLLPGMDGISVCRNIRRWSNVPLMVVTAKMEQENSIAALDAGADDYVVKPFLADELLARIRALLRRGDHQELEKQPDRFQRGGLVIEFQTRAAWLKGDLLDLTATEFDLLAYMARHRRQVLTYRQLIEKIWGPGGQGTRHGLSVHISRLRRKIEADPRIPHFIVTRWGVGYVFLPEDQ